MLAISIIGKLQNDNDRAITMLLVFFIALTIYYFYACKGCPTISKDEYTSVFRFTIIKFNIIKRNAKRNSNKPLHQNLLQYIINGWRTLLAKSTQLHSTKIGYSNHSPSKSIPNRHCFNIYKL
ncbi:hypothetical protein THRCLA_10044 [Thraustotheca clavata]|uniref:Uncharacterized protein n=1 Tax=Thraustotheca clavata TaxID=74557 RepID=A0A1V9YT79_9STRA|nr:hypothetical protein THRCLA_10044 [Thraustotheca clavata]